MERPVREIDPGVFCVGKIFRRESTPLRGVSKNTLEAGGCSAMPSSSGWGSVMDK